MTNQRPPRACLWLRVSTDTKGQDPALQRADLERVCQQRGWEVVNVYEVEESAFGKKPREQFQAMLEDGRKGKFDVLVAWSMDRFSRKGEWSVSRIMASLQDWHVQFYSYNEPFLDTTGPFAGFPHSPLCLVGPPGEHPQGQGGETGHGEGKGAGQERGTPRSGGQGGR